MSYALSEDAPETDLADAEAFGAPPGDGTAVGDGSAEEAATETVDAKRFNGLMSAHQRTLDALAAEREARIALEARLQEPKEQQNVTTGDDATLSEVQQLRSELAEQRLEAAKAKALAKYPDAAPFADLIVGSNASEVESVAAAIAQRMVSVKESMGITAPETSESAESVSTDESPVEATTTTPTAPQVPVIAGGNTPPGEPTNRSELLNAALQEGSWDKFWQAKSAPDTANNLA